MYHDIICFNNGGMIFKHISDISIYITRVSPLIYLWRLTSLNKHEHGTFQNQNAARVIYMNVSLTVFRIVLITFSFYLIK